MTEVLNDISARCDPCQQIHDEPKSFRISSGPQEIFVNKQINWRLIYNIDLPLLQTVADAKGFCAAKCAPRMSSNQILNAIVEFWDFVHTKTFTLNHFLVWLVDVLGIILLIEFHNSLGVF